MLPLQLTRKAMHRPLFVSAVACIFFVFFDAEVATAQNRIFNSFSWHFDFDGTDAQLRGFSEKPGRFEAADRPNVSLVFDCSKKWIRLSIRGNELANSTAAGEVRLFVDDRIALSWMSYRGELIAVTTRDAPVRQFVRDIFVLTAELYHSSEKRLRLVLPNGEHEYRFRSGIPELEHRAEIVAFRQQCASWWDEFL